MILQIIKIKVIILHINLREAQEEVTCPMILNGDWGGKWGMKSAFLSNMRAGLL